MRSKKKYSKQKEERTCGYKIWESKPCGRALYDDEHCIFHSKDIERKKYKFNDAFWKEFERQKEQEEIYDFKGFVFAEDISFEMYKFEKVVSFFAAHFTGNAAFRATLFSESANFSLALFSRIADFSFSKFNDTAIFFEAEFKKGANFSSTIFKDFAKFHSTRFSGEVDFNYTIFLGPSDFKIVEFSNLAHFKGTEFFGRTDFTKIKFQNPNECKMIGTTFNNVIGLFKFIEENKKKLKYSKKPKLEFLPDNFYLILGEGTTARYPVKSRQIKDDMYLLDNKEKISKIGTFSRCFGIKRIIFFLWWLFADYGRSFLRWAGWSLFFAFLFGLIYTPCFDFLPDWWIDLCNKIGPQFEQTSKAFSGQSPGFWSSMYFSIVTFTTLGFGDIVAANITARILVTIEVILGYIMLGGLISILANKLARRS